MSRRRVLSSFKRRLLGAINQIKSEVFFDDTQDIYYGKTYRSYWEEYYGGAHRPFLSTIKVKFQARRAFFKDGFRPDEFYLLGLENKKKEDRDFYLSRKKEDEILVSYYGSSCRKILDCLKDKYLFYTYLKDFYKREAIYISGSEDLMTFLSFCERHHQIFAKPNKGSCGIGVKSFTVFDNEKARMIFDELVCSGEWIVEELIKQDPAISAFNSSTINTVRFPSFKRNGVVKCVLPCMRFGRIGSIVDNSTQGGVTVAINDETGELYPFAYDERGKTHVFHPDSKVEFRGFYVPQWDHLIEFVKTVHLALPDNQVYVAFDCALSDRGWCIVEGNWGDWFLQQLTHRQGLKKEFVSLLFGKEIQ